MILKLNSDRNSAQRAYRRFNCLVVMKRERDVQAVGIDSGGNEAPEAPSVRQSAKSMAAIYLLLMISSAVGNGNLVLDTTFSEDMAAWKLGFIEN